ncbi:MAG: (Fe-S)-binding protein [Deltaproteobacteria bacterium]|nr:MAG: (Fe-S)-binding protein [Deltaproteobacteria bacterium]
MGERKVTVFVTCLADTFRPDVAEAVVTVLERFGVSVKVPAGQTCCGQPAYNAGYLDEAKKAALHFLDVFDGDDPIVCPSGSCASMVKHGFLRLFEDDPQNRERAEKTGERVYEFTQFLVKVLGVDGSRFSVPGKVTYHASCHTTRHLGVRDEPLSILKSLKEGEFVPMRDAEQCCGFGGLFMAKLPEISCAIADEKAECVDETGADLVTGCDLACLFNIQDALRRRGSRVRVEHIARVLAGGLE